MRLKVKDNGSLVRDSENFAILNTDRSILKQHEQKMDKLRREKVREAEINNIKGEISEIKDMLAKLLQQSSKE